jgi:uncharacterized protein
MVNDAEAKTTEARGEKTDVVSARSGRIPALDVLRGIAIIGTLASNIWLFVAFGTIVEGREAADVQAILTSVSSWLPNGKFLGLLTIMFGIGLEIQRQSAVRAGKKWPGTYLVRAGLLFIDGVVNYIFVVQFDVLRAYAVTGLIVAFLLLTSERVQWWLMGIFVVVHIGVLFWASARWQLAEERWADERLTDERWPKLTDEQWAEKADFSDASPEWNYWENVRFTLENFWSGFGVDSEFFTIVLMGIALFLLGAKLYRLGIFSPERKILRRWLMIVGFGVALPLDAALAFTELGMIIPGSLGRYGAASVVALGILALVAEFYQKRSPGWMGRHLAFVGGMALSCYLLQNIIGVVFQFAILPTGIFDGLGSLLTTYLVFALITVMLIVFSRLWLSRFSRGPFELLSNWLFRVITRERRRSRRTLQQPE